MYREGNGRLRWVSAVPSAPEVQRLLRVMSTGRVCAEVGTGLGDGAAAMAETATSLVTVESEYDRALSSQRRLAHYEHVRVVHGGWREVLGAYAPFEFMFLDGPAWPPSRRPAGCIDRLPPAGRTAACR